jgi:hypothetical protein
MTLEAVQFIERIRDGHEHEFKLTVNESDGGWEAVLYTRPVSGRGWERYAGTWSRQRIDCIQAIAHYVVTA